MLTSGPNQYLQPDYLSPLPTTLDAKKSPLALLAQTCSQIGADTPAKPLSQDKPAGKKHSSSSSSSSGSARPSSGGPSPANKRASPASASSTAASPPAASPSQASSKLAFKPYEANVLSRRDERPPSKSGSEAADERSKSTGSAHAGAAPRKSSSPRVASPAASKAASTATSQPSASSPSASPLIRSGLEVLQGHGKDPLAAFKAAGMAGLAGLTPAQLAQLCVPPGYPDAHHPAFRPPFAGTSPFSHQHAAALLAAGYHNNPYFSYQRVKSATGVETIVPICKDPFCQGCQYSMHNTMLGLGVPCPPGCTTCDHHKYSLSSALAGYPPGAAAAAAAALQGAGRPYVCSWIAGESYCGKRFASSDELLQHLRSHTGPAGGPAAGSGLSPVPQGGLPSPTAYSRYHPYAKPGHGPGASPTGLLPPTSSPYAFSPAALSPGLSMPLSPYAYSPYALYGQRMGAAVHP
ncbi:hypothetical protein ONE63_003242 [Megalurothrips usitatus]|uniref:C2H2-type domain-containing protein n=1 Tax=Megalurothrips usitatus TaxID=439358 RepID=A0AAV7X7H0_9NEOP|nr:hypothetical protein ONE63_003242 [Megalurothrips usitatus]